MLCFNFYLLPFTEAYVNWNASEKQLKESDLMPPITLVLSETGVRIMERYNSFFRHAALKYVIMSTTCVKVQTAPLCFMEKVMNEVCMLLSYHVINL